MTSIGAYQLVTEFRNAGGGQCRWAFAERDGREYFIKEFLKPTYPVPGGPGSAATKERKRRESDTFEARHRTLMATLGKLSLDGGNLIVARDFFRHGAKFYKVTDKVDVSSTPTSRVHAIPFEKQLVLAIAIAHSLQILHRLDLVHGDLKPPNILLKETKRDLYTAKLIDFDDSYVSQSPPSPDDLVGDISFYAPETHLYVEGKGDASSLRCSADIFSLAIVLSEYFTGHRPIFLQDARTEYPTAAVGALNGASAVLEMDTARPQLSALILSMLELDFQKRPSIADVIAKLKHIRSGKGPAVEPVKVGDTKPRLRGSLLETGAVVSNPATRSGSSSPTRLRGSLSEGVKEEKTARSPGTPRLKGSLASRKDH